VCPWLWVVIVPKQLREKELKSCPGTNYFGRQLTGGDLDIFFPIFKKFSKLAFLAGKTQFTLK
jgi:hypothetical protein